MKDEFTKMRRITRSRVGDIWRLAQLGIEQEGEDALTARILEQHPEYSDVWVQADDLPPEEDILREGGNPFAHIAIHQTVENQIADLTPPQAAETLEALIQAGHERHDAIHAIGSLVAAEIFEIMKNKRPFDQSSYVEALRELAQAPKPRPRPRRRTKRKRRKR